MLTASRGLLFAQGVSGYQPLRKDRRKPLEDGSQRPMPRRYSITDRAAVLAAEGDEALASLREDFYVTAGSEAVRKRIEASAMSFVN